LGVSDALLFCGTAARGKFRALNFGQIIRP